MGNLSQLVATVRLTVAAAVLTALCAGGIAGHSVTKDLGGTALAAVDGNTTVPSGFNLADRDAGGPELVRSA